jgi:hypothetical protein
MSIRDKIEEELQGARKETSPTIIHVTRDEARNGWDDKTLTAYLAERQAGQSLSVDVNSLHRQMARRPNIQNHKYRPLRWRS